MGSGSNQHSAWGWGMKGYKKTLQRVRTYLYIPRDKVLLHDYVNACATCQQNKTEQLGSASLLQSLEVLSIPWSDITMDFVEGLPHVHGKSVLLMVVDIFSKFARVIALGHPYTATSVA